MKNLVSKAVVLIGVILPLFATVPTFAQYVPPPTVSNFAPPVALPPTGVVTAVNTTSSYAVNVAAGPVFCGGNQSWIVPAQITLSNPYMVSNSSTASPTATWYVYYNCLSDSISATILPSAQTSAASLLATVVVGCNTCLTTSNDIISITANTVVGMFPGLENVITFSATPVLSNQFPENIITLTANVTSSTLAAGWPGQLIILTECQNGTGSFTFAFPANVHGATTIGATASKCSSQQFVYSAVQTAWVATGTGVINQ